VSAQRQPELVELADLNVRFGHTREQVDGRIALPLVRVVEVANGRVVFDPNFIPPLLDASASQRLHGMIVDITGRADQRLPELAQRAVLSATGSGDMAAAFLLLQALNRWTPQLHHLQTLPNLHPERLFEMFVGMAGELATLTIQERRPPSFAPYDHINLQGCFEPVFELLQREVSMPFGERARQLPLEERGAGAYTAQISDPGIFRDCNLYLAASARVPNDVLLSRFPSLVKIGPATRMREIVNDQLRGGVHISPATAAPPEILALHGYAYFELDRSSAEWRDLAKAPAIGIHVAGPWPDLKLELWSVKRTR
jgi:type VI secretion system protein ImpJ